MKTLVIIIVLLLSIVVIPVYAVNGYPFANSDTNGVDPWGFYYRQCTSYAAWYFNAVEGASWYNTRPGSGSAWNWPVLAADQGYSVGSTPRAGAIASWDRGGLFGNYGYVAIVESVNIDGTINVSEYNWIPYSYSERNNVSTLGVRFIYSSVPEPSSFIVLGTLLTSLLAFRRRR